MQLSVIICTFNPSSHILAQTLAALRNQNLPFEKWELIIIDNNSTNNFAAELDLQWHPNARLSFEKRPGLTYARLKGFQISVGQYIVLVDDDNLLGNNYLYQCLTFFSKNSQFGAIGGKSIPLFEDPAPAWLSTFYPNLAIRDLGSSILTAAWNGSYPNCSPIGAGMCLVRSALTRYIEKFQSGISQITDRQGDALGSGGDNDMVIEILKQGWYIAYVPQLELKHYIPNKRMKADYMANLVYSSSKSWAELLRLHNMSPWKKINRFSLSLRKTKAWFVYKAWRGPEQHIKWRGVCGIFEGLSTKLSNGE